MNLIPKDGGQPVPRRVQGVQVAGVGEGDNLTDDLKAMGVSGVDRISNFYEWNVEQGGPIVKNKLWFYGAFRKARYDRPIANTFIIPASTSLHAFAACQQNPGG